MNLCNKDPICEFFSELYNCWSSVLVGFRGGCQPYGTGDRMLSARSLVYERIAGGGAGEWRGADSWRQVSCL
jgi:hypothetical protein